ncbi:hypothetical protein LTR37_004294 [Vermiconidia calcicola]|uniref:Uncharacterized protein n=1 Tax=Vermiconidia calcicola TaxID=1690605 RepID=A0ACC3NM71_9PEZI|nr:hypothetical protein LTR37_004294 [Vermiconidia calcicola]
MAFERRAGAPDRDTLTSTPTSAHTQTHEDDRQPATAEAAKMPPLAQVLETYELLEAIIANLPISHIFVVERVSKTWNAVILRSGKLQQLTFRRPAGDVRTPCELRVGRRNHGSTVAR